MGVHHVWIPGPQEPSYREETAGGLPFHGDRRAGDAVASGGGENIAVGIAEQVDGMAFGFELRRFRQDPDLLPAPSEGSLGVKDAQATFSDHMHSR